MDKFFKNRNKKVADLNLMADSLGHSLRENVSLFSIDDFNSIVTFVTESGNVIQGNYYFGDEMILDNITVEAGEVFTNEEKFDSAAKNQISLFVESVFSDDIVQAGSIFENLLDSWGERIKFNKTVSRLQEKSESFNNTFNIVESKEFERFFEVADKISGFLAENRESISEIPEIVNAVKLSNTVANAFNIPRTSLEDLQESKSFSIPKGDNKDIYEMICQQELVKKEILESKKSFDTVWVSEPSISNLAVKIFEEDEKEVAKALIEAVIEIPYLSLVSKKKLSNTISNCLNTLHENSTYTKNELKDFVGRLFEMKKPLKELVSNLLQEKYGVNINNIKETPTFKTLLNTQVLIFECLSKLSPRNSIIKESMADLASMLKSKNGVQAIDVNNAIRFIFEEAGYGDLYEEGELASTFSLNEAMTDDVDSFVALIMEKLVGGQKKLDVEPKGGDGDIDAKDLKKLRDRKKKGAKKDSEDEDKDEKEEAAEKVMEEDDAVSTMTTADLMKTLSDLEELIDQPTDLGDE
jgi:hypothetical protein